MILSHASRRRILGVNGSPMLFTNSLDIKQYSMQTHWHKKMTSTTLVYFTWVSSSSLWTLSLTLAMPRLQLKLQAVTIVETHSLIQTNLAHSTSSHLSMSIPSHSATTMSILSHCLVMMPMIPSASLIYQTVVEQRFHSLPYCPKRILILQSMV